LLNKSEDDYIVNLTIKLIEATSQNDKVPVIIPRILLNNLFIQIQEKEIELTSFHIDLALSIIHTVRPEILFDYVTRFKLANSVN
jgi:hypothetical protein